MSIKLKLTIVFLPVAIIPTLFVSIPTFHNYKHCSTMVDCELRMVELKRQINKLA